MKNQKNKILIRNLRTKTLRTMNINSKYPFLSQLNLKEYHLIEIHY